ncbi:MAG: bifunctional (p)ppGpp synthetase/guanosine-3',5'-bis(diphosphate) 3'-pyrophosphohydrolase [Rhodospirillaceae bacterium]|jgi:GTP diphosphokinase / guanosine-3',5'-bis(diphosphate) 3'-diphosphatase|nr:bifunctional (p)ppGpp synthetase/guanosine-3',5'-bis(diphosphate) 3'-pyrophosphohydrolase [Rhodospirillaceae bacterium]MBT4491491.1 bifunctional (p)ppGpp synthetase/guanosine-3',5'-bis(diphosphate) 3'-pyrophosphohydrolase [Rhodospirillaceae bacterium]MBT5896664.1 bifunctional (p)ppGpp synthetase/guanosine-3',5'-bis(diphosphate) 3'-pyrophosphohydrolase [Rhodospirillaceae bacterium]MBT7760437.1 bifunctional (p)ppGpp synthetase/guanosine-3',5'-bis(diphosphate) 3'-pyrophosphohydrolase [Rhodospiri
MIRQFELVERVADYDSHVDEDLLNRAYVFSMKAHGSQLRASGDAYFSHPVEVAAILADYKLDCATIATALLHDTVEDTVATIEQIRELFGPDVGRLVDGVTKLAKLELHPEANQQAENFRKLVLAMSNDIRVLLVKLADRLHNMQTLNYLSSKEKRLRIATETMEIYAPLAERLGMQRLKQELEDLAFAEQNPDARKSVQRRLEFLHQDGDDIQEFISAELEQTCEAAEIPVEVTSRVKTPYSIWHKMQRDHVAFEQLSDTMAFRLMVDTVADCYQVLGVVHGKYKMVPGRFKDYISTPKSNNYQSLHTTVIGPDNRRIEIQIRTSMMHRVAELGVAAHWQYKQNVESGDSSQYRWLQGLLEILEHAQSPEEFLEHTKLEMYSDQVFCFTPRGGVIALPRNATSVDFAYALHTDVGHTCVGCKVNGRVTPLRTQLRNGDQVEILRSSEAAPDPAWESFVVTGKARAAIRRFVRAGQREDYRKLGQAIAEKAFRESGHEFTDRALENVLKIFDAQDADDIFVQLGQGHLTSRQLLAKVFPGERRWRAANALGAINRMLPARLRRGGGDSADDDRREQDAIPIHGLTPGLAVHYAACCHPLPGDRIVGIVNPGKGIDIHAIDCAQLANLPEDRDNWIDVRWDLDPEAPGIYVGRIDTVVSNQPGSLSSLSSVIAKNMGNISNLRVTDRSTDFFRIQVDIEVADLKHLTNIIAALRATPDISSAERVRG